MQTQPRGLICVSRYWANPEIGLSPSLGMALPWPCPGSLTKRRLEAWQEELEERPLHTLRGTLPGSQTTAKNSARDRSPLLPAPAARNLLVQGITRCADGRLLSPRPVAVALRCASAPASEVPWQQRPFYKSSVAQPTAGRSSALPGPARPGPALPGSSLLPPSLFPSLAPSPALQGPATPAGGTHPGDPLWA